MQKTGRYTGKIINIPDRKQKVTIGKISGYTGTGKEVYDILSRNTKIGELDTYFISQYLVSSPKYVSLTWYKGSK